MSFATVHQKIYTILSGITGTGKTFKVIYDYIEPKIEDFPACLVQLADDSTEESLDSNSNVQKQTYNIYALISHDSTSAKESKRLAVLDSVLDEFRKSANVITLGGTVQNFEIVDIQRISLKEPIAMIGTMIRVRATLQKTFA